MIDTIAPDARTVATDAAAASRVRIETPTDLATLQIACEVADTVWQPPPGESTLQLEFVRALTHAGNYCTIAWDGDQPIGMCLGFLAVAPARELHSHIAGVTAAGAGRHIGRALKLDQRAWALEHSLDTIGWTFDPLVRRNAFFNACRLGALPTSYLVDFYGEMTDAINAGQPSDRVKVSWRLADARVIDICAGRDEPPSEAGGEAVLEVVLGAAGDRPVRHDAASHARRLRVQVPADIEGLRRTDPALARQWRLEVRDTLGALMQSGWHVTGFGRDGYYVLDRTDPQENSS